MMGDRRNGKQDLSGKWKLRWADGQRGSAKLNHLQETDEHKWMEASVPGEIHLDLIKAGLLQEPTEQLNALSGRWVEECLWSYRTTFTAVDDAVDGASWLYLEGLDYHAEIYLNEELIGEHENFYYPCRICVTGKLRKENLLVVVIDSGLFGVAEKSIAGYFENSADHALHKRIWLRKPQCSFGWDWSTRYVNVGIYKPVSLEWADKARMDEVVVLSDVNDEMNQGFIKVRAFVEGLGDMSCTGILKIQISGVAGTQFYDVVIHKGMQRLEAECRMDAPQLWWPVGHGNQPLYDVHVQLWVDDTLIGERTKRIGFRKLTINQNPHPSGGRYFYLEINGRPVFAKGANFVPTDMIFSRADRSRYDVLLDRALEANFNFLRVWGGGLYETDDFYELCDEKGIMVWQDFIFACGAYPIADEAFMSNVKQEAIYNVRRLAHHPSLVMYCGNNENEWHTFYQEKGVFYPDYALYHHVLPRIVQEEDPGRYYQPSSPYSPDHEFPNADHVGDQHPWSVGFENTDFREYREMVCRFPNEGGMLGSTSLQATNACLPEDQRHVQSFAWQFHDNGVDSWFPLSAPDRQIREWIGKDPLKMSIEEFVYYGGFIQGEGFKEYIDNFRRRKFDCASAVFWMYNDCWPTTRSWTIVDYYLNRTPAFYPVKRAFQPISIVVVREESSVKVYGVNETQLTYPGELECGLFTLSGDYPLQYRTKVDLPPNTSTCIAEFDSSLWDESGIHNTVAFAELNVDSRLAARNRLIMPRFVEMNWPSVEVHVRREGDHAVFACDTFAMGVCIDLDGREPLKDNFFDVWPGKDYRLEWPRHQQLPKVLFAYSNE